MSNAIFRRRRHPSMSPLKKNHTSMGIDVPSGPVDFLGTSLTAALQTVPDGDVKIIDRITVGRVGMMVAPLCLISRGAEIDTLSSLGCPIDPPVWSTWDYVSDATSRHLMQRCSVFSEDRQQCQMQYSVAGGILLCLL